MDYLLLRNDKLMKLLHNGYHKVLYMINCFQIDAFCQKVSDWLTPSICSDYQSLIRLAESATSFRMICEIRHNIRNNLCCLLKRRIALCCYHHFIWPHWFGSFCLALIMKSMIRTLPRLEHNLII